MQSDITIYAKSQFRKHKLNNSILVHTLQQQITNYCEFCIINSHKINKHRVDLIMDYYFFRYKVYSKIKISTKNKTAKRTFLLYFTKDSFKRIDAYFKFKNKVHK